MVRLIIKRTDELKDSNIFNIPEMNELILTCYYNFDKPIDQEINSTIDDRIEEIFNNGCYFDDECTILDSMHLKHKLEEFCNKNKTDNKILCFDTIEIECDDIEVLRNIEKILPEINIPIIINLRKLSIECVQENLELIDKQLKKKYTNITYTIKYNLYLEEAHFEDVSSSCEEVLNAINKIIDIKQLVSKYNLSPFEKIMYVYDIIRSRVPNNSNHYIDSRDVVKVLNGNDIVCLGYSKLFEAILTELGFKSTTILLNSLNPNIVGHARNSVVIEDDKYNLNHILFFDLTGDSKSKKDPDYKYLSKYVFFARPISLFNEYDRENNYQVVNKTIYDIEQTKEMISKIENEGQALMIISKIYNCWKNINIYDYLEDINIKSQYKKEIVELLLGESNAYKIHLVCSTKINIIDFVNDLYDLTIEMLTRKVSHEQFAKCLYQVRRVEYYQNPNAYSFDNKIFQQITLKYSLTEDKLLPSLEEKRDKIITDFIRGVKPFEQIIEELAFVEKIDSDNKMETDIERIKLLSKLSVLNETIKDHNISPDTRVQDAIKLIKK